MDELCQRCGGLIASDAEANVWLGQHVVCSACLHDLKMALHHSSPAISFAGMPGAAWMISDGTQQRGPYETDVVIEMLRAGDVDYRHLIWRDGMTSWRKVAQLFTIPEFTRGLIALRDHGQGDGTYRSADLHST